MGYEFGDDVVASIQAMKPSIRRRLGEWLSAVYCLHCGNALPKYENPKSCPCVAEWEATVADVDALFDKASRNDHSHPAFKAIEAAKGNGIVPLAVVEIEEPSE